MLKRILTVGLMLLSTNGFADSIKRISLELPQGPNWTQVTNQIDESQYTKEWVKEGEDPATAEWIITQKMIKLTKEATAKSFMTIMFSLARKSCTHTLYNGPEEMQLNGFKTSVGRFMCAHQKGKDFGTFTDQHVVIDGIKAYVVTSELRLPKSSRAGIIKFDKEQGKKIKEFMALAETSSNFVRNSLHIEK